jgi:hypothetical protein
MLIASLMNKIRQFLNNPGTPKDNMNPDEPKGPEKLLRASADDKNIKDQTILNQIR